MLMPPDTPQSDYDFILNRNAPQKKSILPSGNSKKQRILVVAAGAGLLVVLGVIIFSLISRTGDRTALLLDIGKKQAELLRITELAEDKTRSSATKAFTATVRLTLVSDHHRLIEAAHESGVKLTEQLLVTSNTKTDEELTKAEQNNRYDEVLTQILQSQLKAYQQSLQSAAASASKNSEKQTLQSSLAHVNTLLGVKNE